MIGKSVLTGDRAAAARGVEVMVDNELGRLESELCGLDAGRGAPLAPAGARS